MNVLHRLEAAYEFCNARIVYGSPTVESRLAFVGGVAFGTLLDWAESFMGRK